MATYGTITPDMLTFIQQDLESAAYNKMKLYPWMKAIGNVITLPDGILTHKYTKIEKMEPGEVVVSYSTLPVSAARFTEDTTTLCMLGTKVVIKMQTLDAYRNNSLVNVSLQDILDTQMSALLVQIEQFIAYGDLFKNPRTGDVNAGEEVFKGLFNGGTSTSAGDGADDNMSAAGDFLSTITNFVLALKEAGFDNSLYYVISNSTTYAKAELGVHQLNTHVFTNERKSIEADSKVKAWIDSVNFENPSGDDKILVTSPFYAGGPQKGKDKQKFAYRLIESYPLRVIPLNGGNINGKLEYEFAVIWAGAMEFVHATAIQVSGATSASLVF